VRLLHLSVPSADRDGVVDVLEAGEFGYFETAGGGERADHTLVSVVVPADAVEYVLTDLAEEGYDRESFTVSIETDFANFENRDSVQRKWSNTPNRIAPRSLRSKALDMRYNTRAYLWMMLLSAVVAVAGLLLASPAVVVGSMVLAPIVSPMLTASVGAVRRDRRMVVESLRMQVLGLGVAVLAATVFALVVKEFLAVPTTLAVSSLELVSLRVAPGMLSVVVGFTAGAAGAYGLATKGQVSIVGVMVAAALIPTAGAAGIAIAWTRFGLGLGALVLLFVTVVAVNLGAGLMLWYLGYRSGDGEGTTLDITEPKRALLVAGTLLAVVGIVAFVGVGFYQQAGFERTANGVATDVLQQPEYDDLGVVETSYQYVGIGPGTRPVTVTYALQRTGGDYPDLPATMDERLAEATGENVTVRIRYVDYDSSAE
jgi:uncharacterized hydrophobic protein (TIGR00271 family)